MEKPRTSYAEKEPFQLSNISFINSIDYKVYMAFSSEPWPHKFIHPQFICNKQPRWIRYILLKAFCR